MGRREKLEDGGWNFKENERRDLSDLRDEGTGEEMIEQKERKVVRAIRVLSDLRPA